MNCKYINNGLNNLSYNFKLKESENRVLVIKVRR